MEETISKKKLSIQILIVAFIVYVFNRTIDVVIWGLSFGESMTKTTLKLIVSNIVIACVLVAIPHVLRQKGAKKGA